MLRLPNGNNLKHQTYRFPIEDQTHTGQVRRFAAIMSERLEFEEVRKGRVAIIVSELCTNLLKYSVHGQMLIRIIDRPVGFGLEFLAFDRGPGIESVESAMTDGFSTGPSPGTGLGSVRRLSDEFDIYSKIGQGSVIVSVVFADQNQKPSKFNYGAVSVPLDGEEVCGDAWCVSEREDRLDIIMADGLGHGPLAHAAALEAVLEFKNDNTDSLDLLLHKIDSRLHGTRGAAVFLLRWQDVSKIDYVSAGNIRTVIQTAEKSKTLVSQNGTAGLRIHHPKIFNQTWNGEGFLILHSDGIGSHWDLSAYPGLMNCHPGILSAIIYRDFCRAKDDATVFVLKGTN